MAIPYIQQSALPMVIFCDGISYCAFSHASSFFTMAFPHSKKQSALRQFYALTMSNDNSAQLAAIRRNPPIFCTGDSLCAIFNGNV
jgi:hypothetical protein